MSKKHKIKLVIFTVVVLAAFSALSWYLHKHNVQVFNSRGEVGQRERTLMYFALALSLLVLVPVFTLLGVIAWKYREGNTKAKYRPDADGNRKLEILWWLIPTALIVILSVVTWVSSHSLDPYKPLASSTKPVNVEVVALDWRWLFIYPDRHVASLSAMPIPVNTPINLKITADAPMNSLWIPQLGGQVYAMPGMSTQLHLMADKVGDYAGSSANISGKGFAGMKFMARATSRADFDAWVKKAQKSSSKLDFAAYNKMAEPSENTTPENYALADQDLYNQVVMKYMAHNPNVHDMEMH